MREGRRQERRGVISKGKVGQTARGKREKERKRDSTFKIQDSLVALFI